MEVLPATQGAPPAATEKPKSPDEGFSKVFDRAKADAAPPGAKPPEKVSSTQAGEVAGTEQKSPPQQLDSQPKQGKTTSLVTDVNPALLASMIKSPANSNETPPSTTDNPSATQQAQAAMTATAMASGAALKAALPKDALVQGAADQDGDGADADSGTEGESSNSSGVSIKDLAHSDLGKVTIKIQKLTESDSDLLDANADSMVKDPETPANPSVKSQLTVDPSAVASLTVSAPKAVDSAAPVKGVQPLSNEHRDLVYKQMSDRMELLAATRPKESVTIHLQPPDLGSVTVVLKNVGVKMSAEFFASHDGVRDALKEDAGKLTEQLQSKGVAMTHIAVSQSSQPQQTGSNTHYRDRGNTSDQSANANFQGHNRSHQESRPNNFSQQLSTDIQTSEAKPWSWRSTAVDLSI